MPTSWYRSIYSRTAFPVKIRGFWAFCEIIWYTAVYVFVYHGTADYALRKSLSSVAEKPVWGDDMYRFAVRKRHFHDCVSLFPYIKKPVWAFREQIFGYLGYTKIYIVTSIQCFRFCFEKYFCQYFLLPVMYKFSF